MKLNEIEDRLTFEKALNIISAEIGKLGFKQLPATKYAGMRNSALFQKGNDEDRKFFHLHQWDGKNYYDFGFGRDHSNYAGQLVDNERDLRMKLDNIIKLHKEFNP